MRKREKKEKKETTNDWKRTLNSRNLFYLKWCPSIPALYNCSLVGIAFCWFQSTEISKSYKWVYILIFSINEDKPLKK
jgi:hypothetical protein